MKRLCFTGFLCFAFTVGHCQSWKTFPISVSGLTEEEWLNSIVGILELDQKQHSDSVRGMLTYLSTIYTGQQQASRDDIPSLSNHSNSEKEKLLQFLAEFVIWRSEMGHHSLLKGMALTKTVPFSGAQYSLMIPALINHYKSENKTDSILFTLSQLKTNRNFGKQKDIQWYIYFARINTGVNRHEEALKNLSKAKYRLRINSQKKVLREDINLAKAEVFNSLKDYDRSEKLLLQGLKRMDLKSFKQEELKQRTVIALAEIYENERQINKSIEVLEKYLAVYNTHPEYMESLPHLGILFKRSMLYEDLGDFGVAIAEYEKLLPLYPNFLPETHPDFIKLLNCLGRTYTRTNQHHRAYVYFRWAYEMMNSNEVYHSSLAVDVINNLAEVYSAKGDNESAEFHSKEALQIENGLSN